MGLSELIASVVSGIEIPEDGDSLALLAAGGALTLGTAACGAAAVAVFRFMSAVHPSASTATKKTIFQRICMKNLTYMGCGFESYRRRTDAAISGALPDDV
jgi:hypothetical protein